MASNIIRAEDFIDTSDLGNIDKIIEGLDRFNKALDENAKIRTDNSEALNKIRKKEIADLKRLEKQLEATKNTTEAGREETVKLTNTAEERAKAMEKLNGVQKSNKVELEKIAKLEKKVTEIKKELLKVIKDSAKEGKKDNKTLTDKEKVQKKLVDITTEEAAEVAKLNVELQEARKEQKKAAKEAVGLTSAYQKQSEHLRTLKNEFKDATLTGSKTRKELKKMRKEIVNLDDELVDLDGSVKDSFRNIGKYEKAVEKLEKDIVKIAAGAALLGGAFAGLKGSLEASEEGSEDLREATGKLDAVLDVTKNTVATAALDLWDFGAAVAAGDKELGDITEAFDDTGAAIDNYAEDVNRAVVASEEATESTIALEKASRGYLKEVELLTGAIEIQNAIAGDSTRSFVQIQEASEKAILLERQRAVLLTTIAEEELRIIDNQIKARGDGAQSIDLLNQQSEKEIELIGLKNDVRLAELELNKQILENASDLAEQELDFTLDIADRQKAVNERRLQDDQLTLDSKFKIFDETTKILDDSFKEQLKITEAFVAKTLEVNEGLTGEEARKKVEALNLEQIIGLNDEKKIREELLQNGLASEKINNRIREIIVERQAAVQDLADIERDLEEQRREASRTLATDLDVLTQVFKGENLQIDNTVFIQLNKLAEELKALDEDLTLSQSERVEQRAGIVSEIEKIEKKAINDGLNIATEELEERRAILSQELDDIRSGAKEEVESREDIVNQILEIDRQITDGKQAELDKQLEAYKELNNKQVEDEKEKQEELKQIRGEIVGASIELFNESANLVSSIFDNQIAKQEAIGENLTRQKDHELILAGDNAERKIAIENEFFRQEEANRKKTVELQRKQAIFDKAVAITNASVSTALAVAQINANPAVNLDVTQTLRTVLTGLVIGIGAAQIGAIAAAPIPQFWKGTDNAPGGLAIVDEKGAEIRTDKKGRIKDLGKSGGARVVMTSPGDKIYTAGESKSLGGMLTDNQDILIPGITQKGFNTSKNKLDQLSILDKINNNQIDEVSITRAFKKAVKTIPVNKFFWNESGYNAHREEENSVTKYIDSTKLGG